MTVPAGEADATSDAMRRLGRVMRHYNLALALDGPPARPAAIYMHVRVPEIKKRAFIALIA